jgi:hypothetical protein
MGHGATRGSGLSSGEKAVETTRRNSPKCLPICYTQRNAKSRICTSIGNMRLSPSQTVSKFRRALPTMVRPIVSRSLRSFGEP